MRIKRTNRKWTPFIFCFSSSVALWRCLFSQEPRTRFIFYIFFKHAFAVTILHSSNKSENKTRVLSYRTERYLNTANTNKVSSTFRYLEGSPDRCSMIILLVSTTRSKLCSIFFVYARLECIPSHKKKNFRFFFRGYQFRWFAECRNFFSTNSRLFIMQ